MIRNRDMHQSSEKRRDWYRLVGRQRIGEVNGRGFVFKEELEKEEDRGDLYGPILTVT